MELKDIISISGKSGLYSIVGKSKNNVIVESLSEKKRFPIFNTNKISALSDISIYTYDEEVPLSDIYKKIFEKTDGAKTITHTDSQEKLKQEFESLVPNYDKEQVYNSDIRKLFQWYNILHETKKLKLKEDPKSAEKAEKKEASKKQPKEEKESK
jgi:hypothetical protein